MLPVKRKRKKAAELFTKRRKVETDWPAERLEINRILRVGQDFGDRQIAFEVLGMHSTAGAQYQLTGPLAFITDVNQKFAALHPRQLNLQQYTASEHRNVVQRAKRACRVLIMAVRTIGGLQNEFWSTEWTGAPIVVNWGDIRPGAVWDNTNPMTAVQFNTHKENLPAARIRQTNYDDGYTDPPTTNEVIQSSWNRLNSFATNPSYNIDPNPAIVRIGRGRIRLRLHRSLGDGNCQWYTLSQAYHGPQSWQSFAQMKANIRKFWMSVLNNPRHPRHRMYCYFEAYWQGGRATGNFGVPSLTRCLHACSKYCGIGRFTPSEAIYGDQILPMCQVFADYYDVEVIHWDVDDTDYDNPLGYDQNGDPIYAYDLGTSRGPPNANDQIYIFKDNNHHEPGQRPANTPQNWTLKNRILRPASIRVAEMPWDPDPRDSMTDEDLPTPLPVELQYGTLQTRAPREDVDRVIANRSFPQEMPQLPYTMQFMDQNWTDGPEDPAAPLFPNGTMPTIPGNPAALGNPPHPAREFW